jgi:2-iminobutanoate/2-iminopropanoate deaminase
VSAERRPAFEAVTPQGVRGPSGPYSSALVAGNLVFVSGQGPHAPDGTIVGHDVAAQTRQKIANLRACLQAGGADLGDVVRVGVYLQDLADRAAFNEAYAEAFPEPRPTRTTVQAGLNGFLVELDAIAVRPSSRVVDFAPGRC